MSTDTNDTNPATAETADANSLGNTAQAVAPLESSTSEADPGNLGSSTPADEPCPGNEAPTVQPQADIPPPVQLADPCEPVDEPCPGNEAPRNVSPSVAETAWNDEVLEPGDDIGNRIDGPAHHERTTFDAEAAASGTKRPKKRSKKRPDGKDDAPRNKGKGNAPSRERPAFHVGEEVFGKVVEILPDAIFIDLSSKAKAIFDRHELTGDLPQPGDQFIAQVHGDGSRGGMVVLTNNPQREETAKAAVLAASESGELVNALVTGVIKGGVELDSDGLRAFAPGSHVDL
ncbi:MAG: hypothetical protein U1E22_05610, partial [Coriobacteriia bacterium]|nr:hypothetical protein [Coriobacteriia bacterium]